MSPLGRNVTWVGEQKLEKRFDDGWKVRKTWKVKDPPDGCSAFAITETLLHSTVNQIVAHLFNQNQN